MFWIYHIDEIQDDDTAKVAQPQLTGDGMGSFQVGSENRVIEIPAIDETRDLGYMLYGLRFEDGGKPINGDWEHPEFSDRAQAQYYRPHMIRGQIDVRKYAEEMLC